MLNNLNLKNIDDLIYLEGSSFDHVTSQDIENINTHYLKKRNKNKKQIKKHPSFFIYDYRPSLIDFNFTNENSPALNDPAIQPHDSQLRSLHLNNNEIKIKGKGHSFMDYRDYEFEMIFGGIENLSLIESFYTNFNKEKSQEITIEEFNQKLAHLSFNEVFLDEASTLKSEINLAFVNDEEENIDIEKRSVIVVKFEYGNVNIICENIKTEKKLKR